MKKKIDRNAKHKPWTRLIPFAVPGIAAQAGVVAAFQNHIATVFVKEDFTVDFSGKSDSPKKVAHLMIKWADGLRGSDEYFYGLKKRIQREVCGEQADGVELIPAQWREFDIKYHTYLWVLPEGEIFPIGHLPKDIEGALTSAAKNRDDLVTKEDLELFVVRHSSGIVEVFASEKECKDMYGENVIPEGSTSGIEKIGDAPVESSRVGWSDGAKKKLMYIMDKAEMVDSITKPDLPMIEDEIVNVGDDVPDGIEERIEMAEDMQKGIDAAGEERARKVREISESVMKKPKIILPNK